MSAEQGEHFAVRLAGDWPICVPTGLILDPDLTVTAKGIGAIWLAVGREPTIEQLIELNASPDVKALRAGLTEIKLWGVDRWVDRGPRE